MVGSHPGKSSLAALYAMSRGGNALMFDGFGAATYISPEAAKAALVVGKVKLAYGAGGALLKFFPLDFQDLIAKSPAGSVIDLFYPELLRSPSKQAQIKTYKDLGTLIDDWATRKFRWAKDGRRDDGTPYSWAQWADLGKTYLDSIVYYAKLPVTDGYFSNALISMKEFYESIGRVFQPEEWPLWVKLAFGAAGLAAVAYFVNTARDTVRAVSPR